ncbi:Chromosome partition protein Smc [Corynebacterium felinum]|uniref:hypothetical protein n=1 Tax=Corynebacterium felinum TaxID=131318 RepID=UPI00286C2ECA|nr:hypothetical protein [Corynebacterium felinum]WJY93790.1 Chromosome partition protein Smc [Corynebacterium felinum]
MKTWLRTLSLVTVSAVTAALLPLAPATAQDSATAVDRVNQGDRLSVLTPLGHMTRQGGYCTVGFVDKAAKRLWTARHCGENGTVVNTEAGEYLGTLHYRYDMSDADSLMDITGANAIYDLAYIQVDERAWNLLGENTFSGDNLYTPVTGDQLCRYGATTKNTVCGEVIAVDDYLIYGIDLSSSPGDSGGPLWVPGRGFVGTLIGVRSGLSAQGKVTITVAHREDFGFAGPNPLPEETTVTADIDPAAVIGRKGTETDSATVFGAQGPTATDISALLRDYNRRVAQAKEQVARATERAEEKQRDIAQLQRQLEEKNPQHAQVTRELIQAQQEARTYQHHVRLLQDQLENARYDVQAEKLRSTHAREELLKAQKGWEKTAATVESLRTQLRQARDISEGQLRAEYAEKLVELERVQADLRAAQARHNTAQARVEAAEGRVRVAQQQEQEAQQRANDADKRAQQAQEALRAAMEKSERDDALVAQARTRALEAEAQVQAIQRELDALKADAATQDSTSTRNEQQREQIERLEQELQAAHTKQRQADEQLEQLKAEKAEEQAKQQALQTKLTDATTRINQLITEIVGVKAELALAPAATAAPLNQRITELEQQLAQAHAQKIAAVREASEQANREAQQLRARIAELNNRDHNAEIAALQRAHERATTRIAALEQEKQQQESGFNEQLQRALEEAARAQAALAAAHNQIQALDHTHTALKIKLQEQEAENQRLRAELAAAQGSSAISGDAGLVMGILGIIMGIIAAVASALAPLLRL